MTSSPCSHLSSTARKNRFGSPVVEPGPQVDCSRSSGFGPAPLTAQVIAWPTHSPGQQAVQEFVSGPREFEVADHVMLRITARKSARLGHFRGLRGARTAVNTVTG